MSAVLAGIPRAFSVCPNASVIALVTIPDSSQAVAQPEACGFDGLTQDVLSQVVHLFEFKDWL